MTDMIFNAELHKMLVEMALRVFRAAPVSQQPRCVVHVGGWDGDLLQQLDEGLRDLRSPEELQKFPITLVKLEDSGSHNQGADEGIHHVTIRASGPDEAQVELKALGITSSDQILWVSTCLEGNSEQTLSSTCGDPLQWAKVIGKHGIIVAQAISLPAQHALGTQLADIDSTLGADPVLMAAACLGLFPRAKNVKTLTEAPGTGLLLAHFERRDYLVRLAKEEDLPILMTLEQRCWAAALQASVDEIQQRIHRYPAGQLALEMDGSVCGVIYSQRIHALEGLNRMTSDSVWQLHAGDAGILQLLAVNILPEYQQMNLGDQLLEFTLQRATIMTGVESVAAVTLCKRYSQQRQHSMDEYIRWRTQHGKLHDPILRFHELHGATIQHPIANYRPADKENEGYGVLVTYDLQQRQRDEVVAAEINGGNRTPEQSLQLGDLEKGVEEIIKSMLGISKETAFDRKRPLMEMGLNSADLISLGEAIRFEYHVDLETTFFFQYNTTEKITRYLSEQLRGRSNQERSISAALIGSAISGDESAAKKDRLSAAVIRPEDIAIIGIGCRLPGGIHGPEQLWEFLIEGRDAITSMPPERWEWPEEIDPVRHHPGIDHGGFLSDIARFDARFFRITPREAELMDPQQRILLELTWETLEDAAYPASTLMGTNTGVFVGASGSDYNWLLQKSLGMVDAHIGTGGAASILANRISYFYDLHGPSLSIDTACSSSLVAAHEAIRSLRAGECEQALVAGVNVMCHPATTIAYYKAGMLAHDGRCKTFDKEANGYVRSEGAAMVLLKPLARAVADNNFIYAVLKGSAINHGGQASGLTVPNPEKQSALLLNACRDADVPAHSIGYLEAHGTGTSLGDPIEVAAIQEAFLLADGNEQSLAIRCGLGSIKTNLGHLEAAAGLAGLIKAALSLKNACVPKHLNFKELNPRISFSDSPLFLVTENMSWERPASGYPRRAGVSSFGSGGANAHAVLEEYHRDQQLLPESVVNGPWLFVLSAKTVERLQAHVAQFSCYLKSKSANLGSAALYSIAFTLQTGREELEVRLALTASSGDEITTKLDRFCAGERSIEGLSYVDTKELSATGRILVDNSADVREAIQNKALSKLGALWSAGASIPWEHLYDGYRAERVFLPTYPFASDHYWIDYSRDAHPLHVPATHKLHPLLDSNVSTLAEQKFTKRLHREEIFLKHHVVQGLMILPGVAHLEMARAAAELSLGRPILSMRNVIWGRPVVLEGESKEVVVALHPEGKGITFEIRSHQDLGIVFSRGKINADPGEQAGQIHPASHDLDAIRKRSGIQKSKPEIFAHLASLGFNYGVPFQLADKLFTGETEALVSLTPFYDRKDLSECQLSPALMDTAIRTSFLIGLGQNSYNDRLRIPFSLGKLVVFSSLEKASYAYARIVEESSDGDYVSHVSILDENGVELLLFENFLAKTFRQKKAQPAFESGETQLSPVAGDPEKARSHLGTESQPLHAASPMPLEIREQPAPGGQDAHLFEKVVSYLKDKISTATKAPADSIASQEPLSAYGIDSVIIMEMNRSLEADFDSLPGTLFFQFGTVQDLAKYFISNHAARLEAILGAKGQYAQASNIDSSHSAEIPNEFASARRFFESANDFSIFNVGARRQEASDRNLDIAIIGLSGRYPQASTVERFWENLKLGVDAIEEIPAARWDYRKYYSPHVKQPGKTNSKWGGFIENVDKFDAAFFNISPREADYMDPQQRLFLEVAWEACEDAGYSWERTRNLDQLPKENNVGVFVGLMYDDYHFFERKISTSYWNSFVANRVSHFFNFRGPSMTVDTACSSSLTSIYMAYESLRNGHCYAAIAGGTNVSVHPSKYARLSQLNMLSSDGKCKSFGKDGNGYVPGEGIGAVLLKRLEDAVRDGDHIYAVIKGGALNHGGKTNGFTVPNPNAQAELISAAIQNSGVPPRTISYIEAHGTGTELGDPIEITGLTNAFRKHTADRQFCVIGSVKSNIGHLEGAAGIAALTKVVLQLQHQQHAPSLHGRITNPLIDFQNSPFILAQELAEWKRPVIEGADGAREYPRRAGISSFGAGGANAHLILEEYIKDDKDHANARRADDGRSPVLVPLSAKTEEQLRNYLQKLLEFCRGPQKDTLRLGEMAYTLQTGRQPMEWRAVFLASDITELCAKIEALLSGASAAGCYRDHAKRGNEFTNVFGSDDDLKEAVGKWMSKRKLDRLAQLWVKGLEVDWTKMYGDQKPCRISLPTYPFSGERYWVPNEKESDEDITLGDAIRVLHPLVHENSSTFAEQKFVSTFSETSPFAVISDQSDERRISEGIYLEMARATCALASGEAISIIQDFEIKSPAIFHTGSKTLTVSLVPENGIAHFEIFSPGQTDGESLLHSCGQLVLGNPDDHSTPLLAIVGLKGRENEAPVGFECEEDLAENGAMRLHPAAISRAWEMAVEQLAQIAGKAFDSYPRRIRSVRLHGEPALRGNIFVKADAATHTADIDLVASEGKVFLSMRGVEFATRKAESVSQPISAPVVLPDLAMHLLTFREDWRPEPLTSSSSAMSSVKVVYFATEANRAESFATAMQSRGIDAVVVQVEHGEEFARLDRTRYQLDFRKGHEYQQLLDSLQHDEFNDYVIVYRWAEGQELAGVHGIFDLLSAIGRHRNRISRLVLTGSLNDGLASCHDFSWIGYERSLKLIMPGLSLTLLYSEGAPLTDEVILQEMWSAGVVRYSQGERHRLAIAEAQLEPPAQTVLKRNGVYLITGGCGGLGEVFAEYLAREYQARLVLMGRRVEDDPIRQKLSRLTASGAAEVVYHAADVSDGAAMRATIEAAQSRFGGIDGIIHAAGIGPSRTMFDKEWHEFHSVLQPKLAGSIALDEAAAGLDVDFICYFSSSSAMLGDFGSCDYSIGNRFQMAFGPYRQRQSKNGKCRNIVINWPLWRDGGMTVGDHQQTAAYLKSSGLRYLERDEGLRIWEQILSAGLGQVLVLAGDATRIRKSLARLYALPAPLSSPTVPAVMIAKSIDTEKDTVANELSKIEAWQTGIPIEQRIAKDLRISVSKVLNLPEDRLDDEALWGDFGFDSISLGELGKTLSDLFQVEIAPSLFFSYSTIKKFCSYLLQEKGASLRGRYQGTQDAQPVPVPPATLAPKLLPSQESRPKRGFRVQPSRSEETPIAIIGLAGRFPGANNVEELWSLLVSGKPTLTEIPTDRWNWRDYYYGTADQRNTIATNRGGFIEDVSSFDPRFFEISPREAELMEPRQRLLLQEAWHAFEDSGYSGKQLRGNSCGVFIGVEEGDHAYLARHQGLAPGNHNAMLAARISYYLDLHGPNMAINTACSSGLVALHLACQALKSGECQMALAGGINLLLSPTAYLMLSNMGMLSMDGQCRPFDQQATGMVPAEAIGVIVLKPLAKALEDRDQIYAVIRGSGTNYDGRTNGITAPNALSQAALLETIFTRYQITPANLQYVMGHSVGSPLGDPIEVQGLSQAIRKHSNTTQFCALGSIKSLVGHSFAASGIVNLIAMCMAMKHEMIPATHCEQPSRQLDLDASPFYLNRNNATWRLNSSGAPRLGMVGGTGMSGTNAFVVLEEPPSQASHHASVTNQFERGVLVLLSAKSPKALEKSASNLRKFLAEQAGLELADITYTLQVGREAMTYRVVFLVRDIVELISKLDGFAWPHSGCEGCFAGEAKKRNRIELSSEDEVLQTAIAAWRNHGKGDTLAQLWINGADFDWGLLYDDVNPRRISLPNYPFARRQFGIVPPATSLLDSSDAVQDGDAPSSFTIAQDAGSSRETKAKKRICVVGAGPSGLVMAKSLREEGHEPVIYEKQDTLGGLWVLRPHKSGGAYKKTRFQTSKYTSVFSDFFVDDITSTFYSVSEVKSYLDQYARKFHLEELIRYNSEVLSVQPSGSKWRVVMRRDGQEVEDEFDGVALCHGMFWRQHVPTIPGIESFPGESFHSGKYYENSVFKGKRVLVIGNGVSGMDIAEEASEVAESVFWSVRSLKLILPRMVGFVPNDCQSMASLLLPSNRVHQVERIRHSMPDYFELYQRSGLLPSRHDLENNPTIHINDNIVRLVAEGKIQVCPEVESFKGTQCRFSDDTVADVDVVVYCTGYDSAACDYVTGIQPNDFAMGIFYHRNPTLVNALGLLPIAFSGSFFFAEMVARWYAQVLSGKYQLSGAELQQRITAAHQAVIGPIASFLFGLKLGFFPTPAKEFKQFWRLLNYPCFPMMYRLRGDHSNEQAEIVLEDYRKKAFVKTDEQDPSLRELKYRILAGLGERTLQELLALEEITPQDYSGALAQRENPLILDWDMQYIQQKESSTALLDAMSPSARKQRQPQDLQAVFERVKTGELDAHRLIATLSAELEYA